MEGPDLFFHFLLLGVNILLRGVNWYNHILLWYEISCIIITLETAVHTLKYFRLPSSPFHRPSRPKHLTNLVVQLKLPLISTVSHKIIHNIFLVSSIFFSGFEATEAVADKVPETCVPMTGGSKPNTAARGKVSIKKKIKLSSSQIEADNLAAAASGEAGSSLVPTVPDQLLVVRAPGARL
ncbi:hypothetical protein CASFOL_029592 [Castilleja foliolosa]|uniref:Uncharacterized protein n=1 Tax=Castilleja foliolosa TaxID=1961234 RepID=A0ABD3C930_9LAMI